MTLIIEDDEKGAADRRFEEDLEAEAVRSRRHKAQFKHIYQEDDPSKPQTVAGTHQPVTDKLIHKGEMATRTDAEKKMDRFESQLLTTWRNSGEEVVVSLLYESANLLSMYSLATQQALPETARVAAYHAAAVFVASQPDDVLRTRFSLLKLADGFMRFVPDNTGKDASRTVRMSFLVKCIQQMYAGLGKKLPDVYKPPSGKMIALFWQLVYQLLQEAIASPEYPLNSYDVDRINRLFEKVQSEQRNSAEARKFKTVAAVIYYQAMKDTQKKVGMVVRKMTTDMAASIIGVCRTSVTNVKKLIFPTKGVTTTTAAAAAAAAASSSDDIYADVEWID
jgi:hypothetical protein